MIKITDTAQAKIAKFLEADTTKVFRVGVSSGGCSGFSYLTELSEPRDDDEVVSDRVVIDPVSSGMLGNATLDYVDSIGFSGFKFDNPDTTSSCGCGMSFDLE